MTPIDLMLLLSPPANDYKEAAVVLETRYEGEPCPFAYISGEKACDEHRYDGCAWETR